MKHIKLQFFAFITIITCITAACSLDGDSDANSCYRSGYALTNSVTGPDSTLVNKPITVNISFKLENSCGAFVRLAETDGYPKTIYPVVEYNGCNCTTVSTTLIKPYTFIAPAAGRYELKFVKDAQQQYLTKTIVVTAQ